MEGESERGRGRGRGRERGREGEGEGGREWSERARTRDREVGVGGICRARETRRDSNAMRLHSSHCKTDPPPSLNTHNPPRRALQTRPSNHHCQHTHPPRPASQARHRPNMPAPRPPARARVPRRRARAGRADGGQLAALLLVCLHAFVRMCVCACSQACARVSRCVRACLLVEGRGDVSGGPVPGPGPEEGPMLVRQPPPAVAPGGARARLCTRKRGCKHTRGHAQLRTHACPHAHASFCMRIRARPSIKSGPSHPARLAASIRGTDADQWRN